MVMCSDTMVHGPRLERSRCLKLGEYQYLLWVSSCQQRELSLLFWRSNASFPLI